MTNEAKIAFGSMRGYPVLADTDKIQTSHFLDGSREIVTLIGEYQKLYNKKHILSASLKCCCSLASHFRILIIR